MTTSQNPEPTDSELIEAIESINHFKKTKSVSYEMIAQTLRASGTFKTHGTTVWRWAQYKPNSNHPETKQEIIRAGKFLRGLLESKCRLVIAIIPRATEFLPVYLLNLQSLLKEEDIPPHLLKETDWKAVYGVEVEFKSMPDIEKAFEALENGAVDVAIGPRRSDIKNKAYASVTRFFQLATIPVGGIFPNYTTDKDLADSLAKFAAEKEGFRVGCLPNADYPHWLRQFMAGWRKAPCPREQLVHDHDEAFDLLIKGAIYGVVGHSVFIANCEKKISQHQKQALGKEAAILRGLESIRSSPFGPVDMDVYVNWNRMTSQQARTVLSLLSDAVSYICKSKNGNPSLVKVVNKLLGLNAMDAKSGKHILTEYDFDVKSFQRETLLRLWTLTSA